MEKKTKLLMVTKILKYNKKRQKSACRCRSVTFFSLKTPPFCWVLSFCPMQSTADQYNLQTSDGSRELHTLQFIPHPVKKSGQFVRLIIWDYFQCETGTSQCIFRKQHYGKCSLWKKTKRESTKRENSATCPANSKP